MTKELAVRYEVDGTEIDLNPEIVLKYMITGDEINISNKEMARIIMTCKARNLNPFTGDVVINHYNNKKTGETVCSLVTTKDFFTRRAVNNPLYRGKKAGVCVLSADGRPVKRAGSCVYTELGERLIGGWCEVYIEGREPEYAEVSLVEYNQHQALWNTKPGTMIRKVAVSQALREAFPNDFNGLYEPEEMGLSEADIEPVIEEPQEITVEIPLYEEETEAEWSEF